MRSNCPAPLGPVRRNGYNNRCGPCTKVPMPCAILLQTTPSVNGIASEPRTLTMCSSSTVTVRLQVSGQSNVQTLGRSSRATWNLLVALRQVASYSQIHHASKQIGPIDRAAIGQTYQSNAGTNKILPLPLREGVGGRGPAASCFNMT